MMLEFVQAIIRLILLWEIPSSSMSLKESNFIT